MRTAILLAAPAHVKPVAEFCRPVAVAIVRTIMNLSASAATR
jgi:hypothetical protein